MNNIDMIHGAKTIINKWISIKENQKLLIVSNEKYEKEANLLKKVALDSKANVDIMMTNGTGEKVGMFFDENDKVFDGYDFIVAATNYSLVTTKATKRAISRNQKFLSLPLHTNNNESMLSYNFLNADTEQCGIMAKAIIPYLEQSEKIRITTELGTDITFYKRNRKVGFFGGVVNDENRYSSASIEVYIPVEEDMTEGIIHLDGSYGYIGKVETQAKVKLKGGKIIDIEDNEGGRILSDYLDKFQDERLLVASELGIGLNPLSKCTGNCYIEDESAYGTFHIGFGRNIALGGIHEASGHFDLVMTKPTVYANDVKVMEDGKIIVK